MNTTQPTTESATVEMTVTVRIPERLARELNRRVEEFRRPLGDIVGEVLEWNVPILPPPPPGTPEERAAAIRAWAESHVRREGITMDDSRESIY